MKKRKRRREADYDFGDLKRFIALPPKEKLIQLEMLNEFLDKSMRPKGKAIWKVLKSRGW